MPIDKMSSEVAETCWISVSPTGSTANVVKTTRHRWRILSIDEPRASDAPPQPLVAHPPVVVGGKGGQLELTMHVAEDGKVTGSVIKRSSGDPKLDGEALRAVLNWRFLPRRKHGEAVASDVVVPLVIQPAPADEKAPSPIHGK